jgi:phosphohistidine phosphatase
MSGSNRRLFLLRHAEAARPPAIHDHERPLSAVGQTDAASMGIYMARAGLVPDFALVSTSARTRETWALVQKSLPEVVPAVYESRIYESCPDDILTVIRSAPAMEEKLIVVGHNPGMHRLALYLVGSAQRNAYARLHADYPPGSLAVIDFDVDSWSAIGEQQGVLERYATPASQSE